MELRKNIRTVFILSVSVHTNLRWHSKAVSHDMRNGGAIIFFCAKKKRGFPWPLQESVHSLKNLLCALLNMIFHKSMVCAISDIPLQNCVCGYLVLKRTFSISQRFLTCFQCNRSKHSASFLHFNCTTPCNFSCWLHCTVLGPTSFKFSDVANLAKLSSTSTWTKALKWMLLKCNIPPDWPK